MKKLLKWIGIVFVVLVVIGIFAGGDKQGGGDASATAKPAEIVKISAVELFQSYEANEVATDERLKGKMVEVSGTVQAIDKDAFDNIVIRLRTPNEFMAASMQVAASEKAKAIALTKGTKVAIQCKKMVRIIGMPHGSDCVM